MSESGNDRLPNPAYPRQVSAALSPGPRRIATFALEHGITGSVAWSHDADLIAVPTQESGIDVWNVADQERMCRLVGKAGPAYALAFDPSGRTLASVSRGGALFLWDRDTHSLKHMIPGVPGRDIVFGHTEALLATAGPNRTAHVWTFRDDLQVIAQLTPHTSEVSCIAFDRSDARLAAGGADGSITVWDVSSPDRASSGGM